MLRYCYVVIRLVVLIFHIHEIITVSDGEFLTGVLKNFQYLDKLLTSSVSQPLDNLPKLCINSCQKALIDNKHIEDRLTYDKVKHYYKHIMGRINILADNVDYLFTRQEINSSDYFSKRFLPAKINENLDEINFFYNKLSIQRSSPSGLDVSFESFLKENYEAEYFSFINTQKWLEDNYKTALFTSGDNPIFDGVFFEKYLKVYQVNMKIMNNNKICDDNKLNINLFFSSVCLCQRDYPTACDEMISGQQQLYYLQLTFILHEIMGFVILAQIQLKWKLLAIGQPLSRFSVVNSDSCRRIMDYMSVARNQLPQYSRVIRRCDAKAWIRSK